MKAVAAPKKTRSKRSAGSKPAAKADVAASFNTYKEYDVKEYTGMQVGRSHKWY